MNLIAWILTLSFMIGAIFESVLFYRAIVCRQIAWLKSTELVTRSLTSKALGKDVLIHPTCHLKVIRYGQNTSWTGSNNTSWHRFDLKLKGNL